MKLIIFIIIFSSFIIFSATKNSSKKEVINYESNSIHQFTIKDINNNNFDMKNLSGNVVLLVNTASKCGFTSQYKGLEELYDQYKEKGLVVIGIPSNNFGNQEPGTNDTIKEFCELTYDVSFPMMSKMNVTGKNMSDLYKFITNKKIHPKTGGKITWNFNKFLINQSGQIVKRYSSFKKPLSKEILADINQLILKKSEIHIN